MVVWLSGCCTANTSYLHRGGTVNRPLTNSHLPRNEARKNVARSCDRDSKDAVVEILLKHATEVTSSTLSTAWTSYVFSRLKLVPMR